MFVTFEGPEGAGKSTLIRSISRAFEEQGAPTLVTREPGAGHFGAKVRELLLHGEDLEPVTELFLFLADRHQHVASIVKPALDRGLVVLCDRHADSTVVYQGYGRGLDLGLLRQLNLVATDNLRPDIVLLLDLPVEVGLARVKDKDRLDAEPIEFHNKVRAGFLAEAAREPERWRTIDATQTPEEIAEQAWEALSAIRG